MQQIFGLVVEQLPGYDRPADYWAAMKTVLSKTLSGEKLDTKYITLREDEAQRLLFEPVLMQLGNKAKRRKDWVPGVTVIRPADAPAKKSRAKKKPVAVAADDGASTSECVLTEDAAPEPPKRSCAKKAAAVPVLEGGDASPDASMLPSDAAAASSDATTIAVVRKSRAKKVPDGAVDVNAGETAATVPDGGVVSAPAVPAVSIA